MRILFTSVGRRVELMQAFRAAAERLNVELKIYGADITESAPALYFCDKTVIVPRIKEPNYIPYLKEICEKEKNGEKLEYLAGAAEDNAVFSRFDQSVRVK